MSEVKPVIKTEAQRISERYSEKTIKYLADHVFLKESRAEVAELRAANSSLEMKLEALQAENAKLKEINDSLHSSSKFTYENQKRDLLELKQENAEQAKRIAELEQAVKANHDHHFIYDEYNGYPDSELFNVNVAALSAQKGTE